MDVAIEELSAAGVVASLDDVAQLLLDAQASGMALGLAAPLTAERAAAVWRTTASRLAAEQRALLEAAAERARAMGLTLLWLTTHADTDSDRIYERLGWTRVGVIPGYAVRPDGEIVDNVFYYLEL